MSKVSELKKLKDAELAKAKGASFNPRALKRKRNLILPTLKLREGGAYYVRIMGKIFTGKDNPKDDMNRDEPIRIVHVTNLEQGELMQMVVPAVIRSTFDDEYPGDAYVGKMFLIEKGDKVDQGGGRGYFTYEIAELEEPEPDDADGDGEEPGEDGSTADERAEQQAAATGD